VPAVEEESEEDDTSTELKEKSFLVREEYVLAHTNNVDIVLNTKFVGHNHMQSQKFYKMITKRQMPDMFEDILYQGDFVRPLAPVMQEVHFIGDKTVLPAELLFIHAQEDLIEKMLGSDETMTVYKDCLVAFEDTVSIIEVDKSIVFVDAHL